MENSLHKINKLIDTKLIKHAKKATGFTLIEILIVIAIIGILTAIAVPVFIGQRTSAMQAEAKSNLEQIRLLEGIFFAENNTYTASLGGCGQDVDNIAVIRGSFPDFRPGTNLNFSYCIEQNIDFAGAAQTPCFRARAFGNGNTPVDNVEFAIDCDNTKTW